MKDAQIVIDTEEISEYMYHKLLERGFVAEMDIVEEMADIMFDYLLDKCVIDEVDEES